MSIIPRISYCTLLTFSVLSSATDTFLLKVLKEIVTDRGKFLISGIFQRYRKYYTETQ